jgi:uncharacterized protein (DUF4415 family)
VNASGIDRERVIREAVTREYVRSETEAGIRSVYDYLSGRTDTLTLSADLGPVRERLPAAVATSVTRAASETAGRVSVGETTLSVDADTVEQLRAGPASYEQTRVDAAVSVAFQQSTPEQRLSLIGVETAQLSDDETERLAEERESEVRAALRERLAGTPARVELFDRTVDVAGLVDQRRPAIRASVCERTRERLGASAPPERVCDGEPGAPENTPIDDVAAAAVGYQYVLVDGLLQPTYEYETFAADATAAERTVEREVETLVRARLDEELGENLTVGLADIPPEDRQNVETARSLISRVDTVIAGLGLAVALLVGAVYLLTRSVPTTARVTGAVFVADAVVSLAVLEIVYLAPMRRYPREEAAGVRASVAFLDGVVGAFRAQSLAVLVLGVGLVVGVAVAKRAGPDEQRSPE